MKSIIVLSTFCLLLLSTALAKDNGKAKPPVLTKEKANAIFSNHLVVKDSLYQVVLTKKEAMKLGITPKQYKFNVDHVNRINNTLLEAKQRGEKINFITEQYSGVEPTEISITSATVLSDEEMKKLCLEKGLPIQQYTVLDGYVRYNSVWFLDVDWKQAKKLGATKEQYEATLADIERCNQKLRESE